MNREGQLKGRQGLRGCEVPIILQKLYKGCVYLFVGCVVRKVPVGNFVEQAEVRCPVLQSGRFTDSY